MQGRHSLFSLQPLCLFVFPCRNALQCGLLRESIMSSPLSILTCAVRVTGVYSLALALIRGIHRYHAFKGYGGQTSSGLEGG